MTVRRTDDTYTHVVPLADGGELVARADHGRIYLDRFTKGRRSVLTTPLESAAAHAFAVRLSELAALASSTKGRC